MMPTNSVSGYWRISPGLGKNEVRLAYVLNIDAINAAMDCLEKALEIYPGKQVISPASAIAAS